MWSCAGWWRGWGREAERTLLRTGDHKHLFSSWPGVNVLERGPRAPPSTSSSRKASSTPNADASSAGRARVRPRHPDRDPEAIRTAREGHILTTGTGSGKRLSYIVPIVPTESGRDRSIRRVARFSHTCSPTRAPQADHRRSPRMAYIVAVTEGIGQASRTASGG